MPEHLKILLVEDNQINRLLLRTMLTHLRHEVEEAVNGQEALDLLERQDFDLVLMDVKMPVMDGLEATRRIRQSEAGNGKDRIPIIAVTANGRTYSEAACFAAGTDAFLEKPVTFEQLRQAVDQHTRTRDRRDREKHEPRLSRD